jgi:hypothetical protein
VWHFDCDPDDLIAQRPSGDPAVAATQGAIVWSWSWERPDLPAWAWSFGGSVPIPSCPAGCAYVFDFRWITLEPVAPAPAAAAKADAAEAAPAEVVQENQVSATARAEALSDVAQVAVQVQEGDSEQSQGLLQQATVVQVVVAVAVAQLAGASNHSVDSGGGAIQGTRATAEALAGAAAEILQLTEQRQSGKGSVQVQVVVQVATAVQTVSTTGVATLRQSHNTAITRRGKANQALVSAAEAAGRAVAATLQAVGQQQDGDDSDQLQLAGQWATVAQGIDLVAAAGVAGADNESRLVGQTWSQRTRANAWSLGSATSDVVQFAVQVEEGDGVAQSQESYQLVGVEQLGSATAAAVAGGTHRYSTAPPVATSDAETVSTTHMVTRTIVVVQAAAAAVPPATRAGQPRRRAALRTTTARTTGAPHAPGAAVTRSTTKLSVFLPGSAGATSSEVGRSTGKARTGMPRRPGTIPVSTGISVASAPGASGGGALAALLPALLLWVPGLGRREQESTGRRPTAVLLRRERPG